MTKTASPIHNIILAYATRRFISFVKATSSPRFHNQFRQTILDKFFHRTIRAQRLQNEVPVNQRSLQILEMGTELSACWIIASM